MTEGTLLWLWLWPDQTCILACPSWLQYIIASLSLYFSISPTFWVGNTIMTIFQPHMRHCGPTDCAARGNLFPMIHIHQMTLKSREFGLFIRLAFFHLRTQSATLSLTLTLLLSVITGFFYVKRVYSKVYSASCHSQAVLSYIYGTQNIYLE